MSRYTLIEKELIGINQAKFQIICNAFLAHEYRGDIQGLGTVEGKEKTRKGKPDAFIVQADGSYVLAEYTTRDRSHSLKTFLKKLQTDIESCLDFKKLGIKPSQIATIVICYNSKLSISEIEGLRLAAENQNVKLRFVGIDTLTFYLFKEGRYYAHQHLNVPFDTGQILNKKEFLKLYNKRNLATPLDNQLIGRERELAALVNLIEEHSIVIVNGPPGVGKSRLSLQAIDDFLVKNPTYFDYYVVSKTGNIIEDLTGIIDSRKNYIFFIDDANRQIGNLLSVIYSSHEREKSNIKIVITVRNYAKEQIMVASRLLSPAVFHLGKLNRVDVLAIISSQEFKISTSPHLARIVEISGGNPRIAIMAARVIQNKPDAKVLKDVSRIYDEYFQNIIDDKQVLADNDTIKVMGIISFFYSIDLGSEDVRTILNDFDIPYDRFVELVFILEECELLEVYLRDTVKVSEQILATYFFYKAFIQDKLLDFSILLSKYCDKASIKDIMGSVYASFGEKQALNNIKGVLINHFKSLQNSFLPTSKFLQVFGTSIPDQTFLFVGQYCSKMTPVIEEISQYPNFKLIPAHPIISILLPFFKNGNPQEIVTAITFSIIYAEKDPNAREELFTELRARFFISQYDLLDRLNRQKQLYNYIVENIEQGTLCKRIFFSLFDDIFLSSLRRRSFYEKGKRGWDISEPVRELRQRFLEDINVLFAKHHVLAKNTIKNYIKRLPRTSVTILRHDETFICNIMTTHFKSENFEDCCLVYEYLNILNSYYSPSPQLNLLKQHFHNEAVIVFEKLNAENFFDRYSPGWKLNETKIQSLAIENMSDFEYVYSLLLKSEPFWKESNKMKYTLDFWLTTIFKKDPDLGMNALKFIINDGNKIHIYPSTIFITIFNLFNTTYDQIYKLIKEKQFFDSDNWKYEYFSALKENFTTEYLMQEAMEFYSTCVSLPIVYSHHLDLFLPWDRSISEKFLLLLFSRIERSDPFNYELSEYFFVNNKVLIEKHFLVCKKVYFDMKSRSYDFDSGLTGLFTLYEVDRSILSDYMDYLQPTQEFSNHPDYRPPLSQIWVYPDAAESMEEIIVKFRNIQEFNALGHVCCIFFNYLEREGRIKVDAFLRGMIYKYSRDTKVLNIVFDISRTCLKDSFLSLVRYFLSINDEFDIFKSILWAANREDHFDYTTMLEIETSQLSELHETISGLAQPIRYIEHLNYLTQQIHSLQDAIAQNRKSDFMTNFRWIYRRSEKYFD